MVEILTDEVRWHFDEGVGEKGVFVGFSCHENKRSVKWINKNHILKFNTDKSLIEALEELTDLLPGKEITMLKLSGKFRVEFGDFIHLNIDELEIEVI